MALKDWKKIFKNRKSKDGFYTTTRYDLNMKGQLIKTLFITNTDYVVTVSVNGFELYRGVSKLEANRFAKAYMKTHSQPTI